jgi:hypothetical protein
MLTTTMKCIAIATLVVGLFWQLTPNLRSYLEFVVTAGAVFVLVQAVNLRKYWWMATFLAVVCLFNPILPIGYWFGSMLALQALTAVAFALSLPMLRTSPRLTIASITEANPRTESL